MSIRQASTSNPIVPLGNEGLIKVVDHFKYQGAFCSTNGTNVEELNSRIGKASAVFRELDKVWRDRNINLDTKLKIFNACVLSTLLYACECWTLTKRDDARLDAFDMHYQRKILQVIWSQHITNSSIRSRIKQPQLTAVIRKCCLQWFGHLPWMNMDPILNKLCHWKPSHRKRRPGQPKTSRQERFSPFSYNKSLHKNGKGKAWALASCWRIQGERKLILPDYPLK